MNFSSDNVTGIAPQILAALIEANAEAAMPYGNDRYSQNLESKFSELFETAVKVFPVATGSAANALALSVMAPPFGAVYCHAESHINADECGAPEFYTGGAKLIPLSGTHGKITADDLQLALSQAGAGVVHHVQPAVVSLTQATEAGTVYQMGEVEQIAQVAHAHGLLLHMDGARFANAVSHLDCTPADLTWRAGVDVLSFGATKNGALAAEAVVFFNQALADTFQYRRKRGGHLLSKMRFVSAQLEAYITDGVWLKFASHANRMAAQIAIGLTSLPGVQICHPVEANEVFVQLPEAIAADLLNQGFQFYRWQADPTPHSDPQSPTKVRLVTAFNTQEADVLALITAVQQRTEVHQYSQTKA